MTRNDGIPELIVIDERSRRETIELCGDEQQGLRCMRDKGHDGPHESLANAGRSRWLSERAS